MQPRLGLNSYNAPVSDLVLGLQVCTYLVGDCVSPFLSLLAPFFHFSFLPTSCLPLIHLFSLWSLTSLSAKVYCDVWINPRETGAAYGSPFPLSSLPMSCVCLRGACEGMPSAETWGLSEKEREETGRVGNDMAIYGDLTFMFFAMTSPVLVQELSCVVTQA